MNLKPQTTTNSCGCTNSYIRKIRIRSKGGQILVEVLIAIAVIATIAAAIAALIVASQRNLHAAELRDVAVSLASEAFVAVRTIAESDDASSQGYNKIYCPPSGTCPGSGKGTGVGVHYRTVLSGGQWVLQSGDEPVVLSGTTYTRFFTIENVCRMTSTPFDLTGPTDSNGSSVNCIGSGGTEDKSTQRITVTVQTQGISNVVSLQYLTRWRTVTSGQSDWSGGAE